LSSKAPTYGRVALIQSAAFGGAFAGALLQVGLRWKPYGAGWEYTVRQVPSDVHTGELKCTPDPADPAKQECAFPGTSVLDLMPGALIGLNAGLIGGLLGAYLPDQSRYGPSWKRVLLVDLAVAAGAVAGGVGGCVSNVSGCLDSPAPNENARSATALWTIAGGVAGLVGGVLLTRHYDDEPLPAPVLTEKPKNSLSTTLVPLRSADGSLTPGLGTFGTF
jgi:hypothetical protein